MKDKLGRKASQTEKKNWLEYMQKNYQNIDKEKTEFFYYALCKGNKKAIEKSEKRSRRTQTREI